ncbi:hypothetical protein [Escherichia coli]|uniref:F4 family fimbrial subunit n=1 Tax=Escherichia coli TaxID=562 RepID=UPI002108494A|nr:hypothetical protein [Escherichia coli]EFN6235782.1 hypothetical protein [Escherichia coli]MCQ1912429.1 hypothetical protein [Escherichia coli]MED8094751.1 hypothetical protein [Escherichia coli]HCB3569179.1 hypothetical protein [Escherichia coli]HCB3579389.1 hypothetical protein [Escherichia coli]
MKKTLIALAVAASAAVSGSAMAWTANGTGGSIELGGTLTPEKIDTPWEVGVGAAVNDLNADIRKGDTTVDIPVKKAIPVLGIRTVEVGKAFRGKPGIAPQINYGGAVNLDGFKAGLTTVSMEVRDEQGSVIGELKAPFFAGAETSQKNGSQDYKYYLYASNAGDAFFGGLAKSSAGATDDVSTKLNAISSEFTANYTTQGVKEFGDKYGRTSFGSDVAYSAYYGSGIRSGDTIEITLNQAAGADGITWKSSLPVTVSYQ